MRKCRQCKVEKDESEFEDWAGKPGSSCRGCRKPVGGGSKAKRKTPKLTRGAAPPDPELKLAFPAGYGFEANTRGDVFQIDQWDSAGEATSIVLSRAELATIFQHFGPWSGEVAP